MPHKHKLYSTLLLITKVQIKLFNFISVYWQKFKSQTMLVNDVDLQKISHTAGANMW